MGLDAAILMNPRCGWPPAMYPPSTIPSSTARLQDAPRADKLIEGWCAENSVDCQAMDAMTNEEMVAFIGTTA